MKKVVGLFILGVILVLPVGAQTGNEPDIRRRLELIEQGKEEIVRAELPTLMTQYQNNPGVLYLQAVLTTDGSEAAKMYQNIVDNFPRSEWADDALFKLYQYYYSIGLYKTADQKYQQLKQDYPFSAYAMEQTPLAEETPKPQKEQKEVKQQKEIVEPRENVPSSTPSQQPQKYNAGFTVQVGAFSTLNNAEILKSKFEQEGYTCNIFTIMSNGKKLHKVWVGEYRTYDEAKAVSSELKEKFGLNAIVVSR